MRILDTSSWRKVRWLNYGCGVARLYRAAGAPTVQVV
jgi:hypothetical protein